MGAVAVGFGRGLLASAEFDLAGFDLRDLHGRVQGSSVRAVAVGLPLGKPARAPVVVPARQLDDVRQFVYANEIAHGAEPMIMTMSLSRRSREAILIAGQIR